MHNNFNINVLRLLLLRLFFLQGVGDALFMSEGDVREAREEARRELVKDESTAEEREVSLVLF